MKWNDKSQDEKINEENILLIDPLYYNALLRLPVCDWTVVYRPSEYGKCMGRKEGAAELIFRLNLLLLRLLHTPRDAIIYERNLLWTK